MSGTGGGREGGREGGYIVLVGTGSSMLQTTFVPSLVTLLLQLNFFEEGRKSNRATLINALVWTLHTSRIRLANSTHLTRGALHSIQ